VEMSGQFYSLATLFQQIPAFPSRILSILLGWALQPIWTFKAPYIRIDSMKSVISWRKDLQKMEDIYLLV
jgi:hypothetical protein